MKTRLACASLAAFLMFGGGCGSTPSNKKIAYQIEPNTPRESAVSQNDAKVVAPPGSALPLPSQAEQPQVVAEKTQAYARSLEEALAKRNIAKASNPPGAPAVGGDANDIRNSVTGGPGEVATALKPPAAPVISPAIPPVAEVVQNDPADAQKVLDASNRPIAIPAEPVASKASAVMSPVSVDQLETRLAKRVKDYPRDVAANLDYQLMLFLREQPVPQLSAITGLPSEDRELVSALMDSLSNLRSTLRSDNNMLLSRKIRPITELADRLRTQAELSIPTLTLCTKVEGFGRYDPIEPARFPAQKENQAIIYCELENFASQLNSAKQYQTDVIQEAVLYTDDGLQVWQDHTRQIQDLSRNRRHDFFLCKVIKLPATLTMGRYMLKVTITDRQANRVAESSLPIQIISQAAVANQP